MEESSCKEPLLGGQLRTAGSRDKGAQENSAAAAAAVNLLFLRRIWHLMRIAQCGDSILLILLSVLEVAIVSQAGLVIGHFYNALISKNSRLFSETVGLYLLWYSAEAICVATEKWAAEWLAIRWRQNLTQAAHQAYCGRPSLCRLGQHHYPVDNPDERATSEINHLCQNLAELMLKTIAAPLMILYYTWWVGYHVGWFGPVVVYAFFAAGAIWTHWIISPIAGLVATQEKLEAFFRISHVRFQASAEAIAMSDSGNYEKARLEDNLQAALSNKKKLVSRHFLLAVSTKAYDYLGGVLNYCVLAIPVFGGGIDSDDSGQIANLISNASFAVLQLIYSFSQVMDTAKLVSDLAGHTSRVGEFFEVLEILPQSKDSNDLASKHNGTTPALEVEVLDLESRSEIYMISPPTSLSLDEGRNIQLSIHFAPPALHKGLVSIFPGIAPASLLIVPVLEMKAGNEAKDGQDTECSVVVQSVCDKELLDRIHISVPPIDDANNLGEKFMELILCIRERLRELGHWIHVLDEGTGAPLCCMDLGERRQQECGLNRVIDVASTSVPGIPSELTKMSLSHSKVDTLRMILGYSSLEVGSMSMHGHPRFEHSCLLSAIFTTAPVKVFQSVLDICVQEVVASCEEDTEKSGNDLLQTAQSPQHDVLTACSLLPALVVDHMTCIIPGSQTPVLQDLTLHLQWGESLLVMGASGSGKTSFLRALCGLWPLHSGNIQIPPLLSGKGILVLPQQPLLAKGGLAGQILYPESSPAQGNGKLSSLQIVCLRNALKGVGMLHLLKQLNDDWEMESDWADTLSPGEQQSLALARVLYHQPQFVILDEATGALSEAAEDSIYQQMMGMGISIISVSHRSRLIHYHTKLLVLLGDEKGGWSLS